MKTEKFKKPIEKRSDILREVIARDAFNIPDVETVMAALKKQPILYEKTQPYFCNGSIVNDISSVVPGKVIVPVLSIGQLYQVSIYPDDPIPPLQDLIEQCDIFPDVVGKNNVSGHQFAKFHLYWFRLLHYLYRNQTIQLRE